jgi:hypothetical protein
VGCCCGGFLLSISRGQTAARNDALHQLIAIVSILSLVCTIGGGILRHRCQRQIKNRA